MSSEIERLLKDIGTDPALRAAIAEQRADLDAMIRVANARGYKVTRAEADLYAVHNVELSDSQLDSVAGGSGKAMWDILNQAKKPHHKH